MQVFVQIHVMTLKGLDLIYMLLSKLCTTFTAVMFHGGMDNNWTELKNWTENDPRSPFVGAE